MANTTVYVIYQRGSQGVHKNTATLIEKMMGRWNKEVKPYIALLEFDHEPTVDAWVNRFSCAGTSSVFIWYLGHGPMSSKGYPVLRLGSAGQIDAGDLIYRLQHSKYINVIADCCFPEDEINGVCPRNPWQTESEASNLVFGAAPDCVLRTIGSFYFPSSDIVVSQPYHHLTMCILAHFDKDSTLKNKTNFWGTQVDFWAALTRFAFRGVEDFTESNEGRTAEVKGHIYELKAMASLTGIRHDEL